MSSSLLYLRVGQNAFRSVAVFNRPRVRQNASPPENKAGTSELPAHVHLQKLPASTTDNLQHKVSNGSESEPTAGSPPHPHPRLAHAPLATTAFGPGKTKRRERALEEGRKYEGGAFLSRPHGVCPYISEGSRRGNSSVTDLWFQRRFCVCFFWVLSSDESVQLESHRLRIVWLSLRKSLYTP